MLKHGFIRPGIQEEDSMRARIAVRILLVCSSVFAAVLLGRESASPAPVQADTTTNVTVHYFRLAGDYGTMDTTSGWNLWMWPYQPVNGAGAAYAFSGTDSFGEVAHVAIPGTSRKVGIIVRQGDFKSKDTPDDRFVDTPNGSAEVWIVQGDPTIYYSQSAAESAKVEAARS